MSDEMYGGVSVPDVSTDTDTNPENRSEDSEIDLQDDFISDKQVIKKHKDSIYDKIKYFDDTINKDNILTDIFTHDNDLKHRRNGKCTDNRVKMERMLKDFDLISRRNSTEKQNTAKPNFGPIYEQKFPKVIDTDSIKREIKLLSECFDDVNSNNKDILDQLSKERAKFKEMCSEIENLDKVEKDIEKTSSEINELVMELQGIDIEELERQCAQLENEISSFKTSSLSKDNKDIEISDDICADINRLRTEIDKLDEYRHSVQNQMKKLFMSIIHED